MTYALLIPADPRKPITPLADATLATLQSAVGGLIESVPLHRNGPQLYVNEEGIIIDLSQNARATAIARAVHGDDIVLLGDAVAVGPLDPNTGEHLPLTASHIAALEAASTH